MLPIFKAAVALMKLICLGTMNQLLAIYHISHDSPSQKYYYTHKIENNYDQLFHTYIHYNHELQVHNMYKLRTSSTGTRISCMICIPHLKIKPCKHVDH